MAAQRAAEAESAAGATAAALGGSSSEDQASSMPQQTAGAEDQQTQAEGDATPASKPSLFKPAASASSSSSALNAGREATSSATSLASVYVDEENEDAMVTRIVSSGPAGFTAVQNAVHASRACLLLLNLKQYLKDVYGMTDR
ncbi:unnamed protein product [Dibothriocephalus latus]|uniref:Uncharacterized protein n=1 Tax=Dibothriocephalus latus TaxID=60516 RepID=A0A3P6Q6G1_DIBLA|nr:unnamed protein product [Dibothriocephalus latus]